jgi:hypothetical protein
MGRKPLLDELFQFGCQFLFSILTLLAHARV